LAKGVLAVPRTSFLGTHVAQSQTTDVVATANQLSENHTDTGNALSQPLSMLRDSGAKANASNRNDSGALSANQSVRLLSLGGANSSQVKLANIDKDLAEIDEQVSAKDAELEVQHGLVREKDMAAQHLQSQVADLKNRSGKLQKEAEVAADIAKERADAASKVEREERDADAKAKSLLAQELETHKFLNQTEVEKRDLQKRRANLLAKRASIVRAVASDARGAHNATTTTPTAATVAPTGVSAPVTNSMVASPVAAFASLSAKASSNATVRAAGGDASLREAMEKLQTENDRLTREKDELESKLLQSRVVQEKALLRAKLKNKLAQKDRIVTLKATTEAATMAK